MDEKPHTASSTLVFHVLYPQIFRVGSWLMTILGLRCSVDKIFVHQCCTTAATQLGLNIYEPKNCKLNKVMSSITMIVN